MLDAGRRKPGPSCFGKQMKGRGQDERNQDMERLLSQMK